MPSSSIYYNTFADQVLLLPVKAISFFLKEVYGYVEDHYLNIWNLEAESSYRITPVTKKDQKGNMRTLGYNFEGNFYVPHNDYMWTYYVNNPLVAYLEQIKTMGAELVLVLGSGVVPITELDEVTEPRIVNSTGAGYLIIEIDRLSYEIESVEFRPRLIIHINKFIKDIADILLR